VLDGVINFVKGIFDKKEESEESDDSSPALVKSLKPTVSIAVLEEKVNQFPLFMIAVTTSVTRPQRSLIICKIFYDVDCSICEGEI
jgi:hypothetical protein